MTMTKTDYEKAMTYYNEAEAKRIEYENDITNTELEEQYYAAAQRLFDFIENQDFRDQIRRAAALLEQGLF